MRRNFRFQSRFLGKFYAERPPRIKLQSQAAGSNRILVVDCVLLPDDERARI
jgi:hypothetical protein